MMSDYLSPVSLFHFNIRNARSDGINMRIQRVSIVVWKEILRTWQTSIIYLLSLRNLSISSPIRSYYAQWIFSHHRDGRLLILEFYCKSDGSRWRLIQTAFKLWKRHSNWLWKNFLSCLWMHIQLFMTKKFLIFLIWLQLFLKFPDSFNLIEKTRIMKDMNWPRSFLYIKLLF